jgi:hypothetical protein
LLYLMIVRLTSQALSARHAGYLPGRDGGAEVTGRGAGGRLRRPLITLVAISISAFVSVDSGW